MKTLFVFLLLVYCTGLHAQQVIATAGSTHVNASGSISYTLGEGIAQTLTNGDRILTQGFHQTTMSVSTVAEINDLGFSIAVFPNPTSDLLKIKVDKENLVGLQYLLFDISGQLLAKRALESNETTVQFKQFTNGFYLLKVQDGSYELKTFKIIKQ